MIQRGIGWAREILSQQPVQLILDLVVCFYYSTSTLYVWIFLGLGSALLQSCEAFELKSLSLSCGQRNKRLSVALMHVGLNTLSSYHVWSWCKLGSIMFWQMLSQAVMNICNCQYLVPCNYIAIVHDSTSDFPCAGAVRKKDKKSPLYNFLLKQAGLGEAWLKRSMLASAWSKSERLYLWQF